MRKAGVGSSEVTRASVGLRSERGPILAAVMITIATHDVFVALAVTAVLIIGAVIAMPARIQTEHGQTTSRTT